MHDEGGEADMSNTALGKNSHLVQNKLLSANASFPGFPLSALVRLSVERGMKRVQRWRMHEEAMKRREYVCMVKPLCLERCGDIILERRGVRRRVQPGEVDIGIA